MTIYAVLSILLFFVPSSISSSTTLSSWTKTNVTLPSLKGRACGYNNNSKEIIILGGYGTHVYEDVQMDVTSYDTTNNNIQSLSPLSDILISCYGRCYTQYNEKLYFISYHKLGVYDMEQKQTIYPLSETAYSEGIRTCIAASYDGIYIFIIGGALSSFPSVSKTNVFQVYDIDQDRFSYGPEMTTIRSSFNCAVSNNYLYAIGGDTGSEKSDTIEKIYVGNIENIASETWHILESKMTEAVNHHECVRFNQYIYILGGNAGTFVNVVARLNTETDTVHQDTPLPIAMYDICGVVTQDERIFVVDKENIYWAQIQTNYPTSQPTVDPTHIPTKNPTTILTENPTNHSTLQPTEQPTHDPTTLQPTEQPAHDPTNTHPSKSPTYPLTEHTIYIYSTFTRYFITDTNDSDDDDVVRKLVIYIGILVNILLFISCCLAAIMVFRYYRKNEQKKHVQNRNMSRVVSKSASMKHGDDVNSVEFNNNAVHTEMSDIIEHQQTRTKYITGNNDDCDVNSGECDLEYIGDNEGIVNGDDATDGAVSSRGYGEEYAESQAAYYVNVAHISNITMKQCDDMDNVGNDEFIIMGDDETDGHLTNKVNK